MHKRNIYNVFACIIDIFNYFLNINMFIFTIRRTKVTVDTTNYAFKGAISFDLIDILLSGWNIMCDT
jgi:hypothetical protein